MQNPKILRFLIKNSKDEQIKTLAQNKLKLKPLTEEEREMYEKVAKNEKVNGVALFSENIVKKAKEKLADGGTYDVHNSEFLTGANISICLTKEFMEAVENDGDYALRFPDVENYNEEDMKDYNEKWHEVGDVREWERMGYAVKTYRTIKAKELWNLINVCATYSAEPGIFFIDNANEMTNASAYGQHVVATNPCGR